MQPVVYKPAEWMSWTLRAAGVYSLACVVLALALTPPSIAGPALELWRLACLLTAVMGLGYILSANDAFRHWPIVLMGFVAKVATSCGIAWEISAGRLPVTAAWFAVVDNLIWLAPLGLILN